MPELNFYQQSRTVHQGVGLLKNLCILFASHWITKEYIVLCLGFLFSVILHLPWVIFISFTSFISPEFLLFLSMFSCSHKIVAKVCLSFHIFNHVLRSSPCNQESFDTASLPQFPGHSKDSLTSYFTSYHIITIAHLINEFSLQSSYRWKCQ